MLSYLLGDKSTVMYDNTALQRQKEVFAYLYSKQIPPFVFARQCIAHLNPYSAGIDLRRQNLTSVNVRF